jgi:hypothetical protein
MTPVTTDLNDLPALDTEKPWLPSLFGKQWEVFDNTAYITLVCGSRLAAKTIACCHRVLRHLWEVPDAHVAIFAKSIKVAKDGGTWQLLISDAMTQWVDAKMVTEDGSDYFRLVSEGRDGEPGPKTDANTRTPFFEVRNYWGGTSVCKLYSINDDNEIINKYKNKYFTMIFFIEFTAFADPMVLNITLQTLRPYTTSVRSKPGEEVARDPRVRFEWLADTNPCEKTGTAHWIYKEFYTHRNNPRMAAESIAKKRGESQPSDAQIDSAMRYYSKFRVIEMLHEDNPFVSDDQRNVMENSVAGDQMLYDSHFRGIWSDSGVERGKLFADLFSQDIHVLGDAETDQIEISKNSTALYTGWDLGSQHHASVIVDKWYRKNAKTNRDESCYSVLDEETSHGEDITLSDFTSAFMEKLSDLEAKEKKTFELVNWADDNALNVFRPNNGTYDYMEILAASNQRILLEGVEKPAGSVQTRIRYIRRLLAEERLFVSWRCKEVIAMLENIKRGTTKVQPISRYGDHIHIFDALSYILLMELASEFMDQQMPKVREASPQIITL